MEAPKNLIDEKRIAEVNEIGIIDGGDWADVLAVSYGPGDTSVRIRFEQSGNRSVYDVPNNKSLAELLNECAEGLYLAFPYDSKPVVTMYHGHQARKWVKRFIAEAERAGEAAEATGVMPKIGDDGVRTHRIMIELPSEPSHWLN
jgi:hypothetical protein